MRSVLGLVAACLVFAACSDPLSPGSASGTYNLSSVDGMALPATVVRVSSAFGNGPEPVQYTYDSGSFMLNSDGSYEFRASVLLVLGSRRNGGTTTDFGTFALQDSGEILFTSLDPEIVEISFSASLVDGTLVWVRGPESLAFQRQ